MEKVKKNHGTRDQQDAPEGYFVSLEDRVMSRWEDRQNARARRTLNWVSVAASILVLGVLAWVNLPYNQENLYAQLETEWEWETLLEDMTDEDLEEVISEVEYEIYEFASVDELEESLNADSKIEYYRSILE